MLAPLISLLSLFGVVSMGASSPVDSDVSHPSAKLIVSSSAAKVLANCTCAASITASPQYWPVAIPGSTEFANCIFVSWDLLEGGGVCSNGGNCGGPTVNCKSDVTIYVELSGSEDCCDALYAGVKASTIWGGVKICGFEGSNTFKDAEAECSGTANNDAEVTSIVFQHGDNVAIGTTVVKINCAKCPG